MIPPERECVFQALEPRVKTCLDGRLHNVEKYSESRLCRLKDARILPSFRGLCRDCPVVFNSGMISIEDKRCAAGRHCRDADDVVRSSP